MNRKLTSITLFRNFSMKLAIITGIVGVTCLVAVLLTSKPVVAQETNQSAAGYQLPAGFQAVSFSCW